MSNVVLLHCLTFGDIAHMSSIDSSDISIEKELHTNIRLKNRKVMLQYVEDVMCNKQCVRDKV